MSETVYKLATTLADYRRAQALCKERGPYQGPMAFPTVLAWRGDEVIGFVSTHPDATAVLCDRVAIVEGAPKKTVLSMMDAYERVLWAAGVRVYYIWIEKDNGQALTATAKLYGEPYHIDDEHAWFRIDLRGRHAGLH
jgi:hypothetical protein